MNPIKILLVDDSKSARYALRLQFKHHNTEVDMADSAEAALERVKIARPDAVFMDHTMPGMNGLEALEILKADPTTTDIPIVMCTSNEDDAYIAQARGKGALDVLAKSAAKAKLPALLEHVREVLASTAPAPAPTPAAPAMDADAIAELVRQEVASEIEKRLEPVLEARVREIEERLNASLEPIMVRGIEERLSASLDPMSRGIEERLSAAQEQNAQAAIMPLMADFSERLTAELQEQTTRSIGEQLQAESERLQNRIAGMQGEQGKLSQDKIANEVIPQAVARQFEQERNNLAQLVQKLIDHSLDNIAEDPNLMNRMQELAGTAATNSAREVAKAVSKEQMESLAGNSADTSGSGGSGTMYVLAAVAALVGIASSVGVYLALS